MSTLRGWAGCAVFLFLSTACHGDCYMARTVEASGVFGDTITAVSGFRSNPGSVVFSMFEQVSAERDSRFASVDLNTTGSPDTVSLVRLTLVSDPTRTPVISRSVQLAPGMGFVPLGLDTVAFNTLFIHIATEDVLFEIFGKNGSVSKALLNLDRRSGPKEQCDPYT